MYKGLLLGLSLLTGVLSNGMAQTEADNFIGECVLKIDTLSYRYSQNYIRLKGDKHLVFYYNEPEKVCEINVFPRSLVRVRSLQLLKSEDFVQLDSGVLLNNEYFRFKIRFSNLNRSQFLNMIFQINDSHTDKIYLEEIKLFPYTKTTVNLNPPTDELYVGEEKVFDLLTNNIDNIRITNEWTREEDINYRLSAVNGQLRIHVLPGTIGNKVLNLKVQTKSMYLDATRNLASQLPLISVPFKIKSSRLTFLQFDQKEVTYDESIRKEGIELSIDNSRNLLIGKTYRVENQEKPGGPLIAELFTKHNLTNDRVLCIFRAYNEHRQTEGYLYGFNGKEKDDEITGSTGAIYDYGFRIYDSRIARFLSVDPLTKSYPWYTPYQFAGNIPIKFIDLDGLEPLDGTIRLRRRTPMFYILSDLDRRAPWMAKAGAFITDDPAEALHQTLNAAGFSPDPFVGTTADALNGLFYVFEGNLNEAKWSAIAIIPIAGDAIKGGRSGVRVFQSTARYAKFKELSGKYGVRAADAIFGARESSKLRGLINNAGLAKDIKGAWQAHHLIPKELIESSDIVRKAIDEGYDFNSLRNLTPLAETKHLGSHGEYTKLIEGYINDFSKNTKLSASEILDKASNKAKSYIESVGKLK